MNKFSNILNAVYCEPWIIRPAMHDVICQIVDDHISGLAHNADGRASVFDALTKDEDEKIYEIVDNVGIINIHGVIEKGVGALQKTSGMTDVDDISDALDDLEQDNVDGILLNIDSPGGTVSGVPELATKIKAMSAKMPIVSFTDSLMASAGYWLGSQAWAIIASPSSVVGSIGVYNAILDQSKAYENAGVKQTVIKAGKFKGIGIPGTTLTDEQIKYMQERVDYLYDQFKLSVVSGRKRRIDDDVMQGQDFFGSQAVENGLIDSTGDIDDAIRLIKNKRKEK